MVGHDPLLARDASLILLLHLQGVLARLIISVFVLGNVAAQLLERKPVQLFSHVCNQNTLINNQDFSIN